MTRRLLIVDDDSAMREMLESLFREQGYETEAVDSFDAAVGRLRESECDVVLCDVKLPGRSASELVGLLRRLRPDAQIVLTTDTGSIDSAIEALRAGAFDSLDRPFEPEAVLLAVERALERRVLEQENRDLRRALDHTGAMGELVGRSSAMRDLFALIRKFANSRASVLIRGESGTGKEVVARTLHFAGARASRPFLPVQCTAIPEALLESELFGHVRGAFAGAQVSKTGLFENANGGTLFFDEIGELGPGLQSKLVRVLQDGEIRPVGGTSPVKVDVRIVAATRKDLEREIEAGRFREDLFDRLSVIPIHIPPLRERPEDVPALVEAFLRKRDPSGRRSLSQAAMERLAACPWRGNARELENAIERALALCDSDVVGAEDLPLAVVAAETAPKPSDSSFLEDAARGQLSLRDLEERYIDAVLRMTGGNKVRASQILGIDRKTLYRRAERRRAQQAHAST